MPKKTNAERERQKREAVSAAHATIDNAKREAGAMLLKTTIPFDGGRAIGDLTRTEALEYSKRLVALAHLLNNAIPSLPEGRTLRRMSDKASASRGQHTQLSSDADFIDEDEDRNPAGVARRR